MPTSRAISQDVNLTSPSMISHFLKRFPYEMQILAYLILVHFYAWYVMVMYLAWDTFMKNHLTTLDCKFFLKLMPENQGHSGRLTVYVQTL